MHRVVSAPFLYMGLATALACALGLATARPAQAAPPEPRRITINAVGDLLFGRYSEDKKLMVVPRVADPFADVAPILRDADLTFCNVESPVVDEPKSFGVYKRMTFRAPPAAMQLVAAAGFDVVSLANNHMFNMKAASVGPTVDNVAAAGLRPGGAGRTPAEAVRPVIVEVHGMRVVFLMYTVWHNTGKSGFTKDGSVNFYAHEGELAKVAVPAVRAARRYLAADFVVVSIHWGIEYEPHPRPGQTQLAKKLVAAGADVLLGHHPHVVQDIRREGRRALVAYSMGNFMFDNPTLDRRETMIVRFSLESPGPLRHVGPVEVVPVMINRKTRAPELARDKEGARWRKRLATLVGPDITMAAEPTTPAPVQPLTY